MRCCFFIFLLLLLFLRGLKFLSARSNRSARINIHTSARFRCANTFIYIFTITPLQIYLFHSHLYAFNSFAHLFRILFYIWINKWILSRGIPVLLIKYASLFFVHFDSFITRECFRLNSNIYFTMLWEDMSIYSYSHWARVFLSYQIIYYARRDHVYMFAIRWQ